MENRSKLTRDIASPFAPDLDEMKKCPRCGKTVLASYVSSTDAIGNRGTVREFICQNCNGRA